jgi:hypothetical protein
MNIQKNIFMALLPGWFKTLNKFNRFVRKAQDVRRKAQDSRLKTQDSRRKMQIVNL